MFYGIDIQYFGVIACTLIVGMIAGLLIAEIDNKKSRTVTNIYGVSEEDKETILAKVDNDSRVMGYSILSMTNVDNFMVVVYQISKREQKKRSKNLRKRYNKRIKMKEMV